MTELLTRQEAADYLGISVITLDRERYAGKLAYIQRRKNGKVWITQKAIEDYLSRYTHQVIPDRPVRETYRKIRIAK